MKRLLASVTAAVFVCAGLSLLFTQQSCASPATNTPAPDSIENTWVLVPMLPSDTATGKLPTLTLDVAHKTFSSFTGCNQLSGNFVVKDNTLKFSSDFTMTKMFCEGYNEKAFIENLLRVDGFRIEDGMLVLISGQTPISKWKNNKASNVI